MRIGRFFRSEKQDCVAEVLFIGYCFFAQRPSSYTDIGGITYILESCLVAVRYTWLSFVFWFY